MCAIRTSPLVRGRCGASLSDGAYGSTSCLARYLTVGLTKVEGWLDTYSAEFIATLSEIQCRAGYRGGVGEIGVHHGKLFILLLLTASDTEKAFVIDVFEQQYINTDHSGKGDRGMLLDNIRRWGGSDTQVHLISRSSLEVHPEDIVAACGKVRLISIDGGHTEQCALNDLCLAEAVLQDWGIAVVDDYFNQWWPGVSTGVAKYLENPDSKLRPFAISPNKVYLCTPQNATFYRNEIQRHFPRRAESRMFGSTVDLYSACFKESETLISFVKRYIKESSVGPRLLSLRAFLQGTHRGNFSPMAGWRYRVS